MKRIVNFRPLFVLFLALIAGIFCTVYSFFVNSFIYFACAVVEIALVVFIIFKIKLGKRGLKAAVVVLIVLFGLVFGNGLGYVAFQTYGTRIISEDYHYVTATVSEVDQADGRYSLILKNVSVDNSVYNFHLRGTLDGYTNEITVGDSLSFYGYFYDVDLMRGTELNSTVFKDQLFYNVYLDETTLNCMDGSPNLAQAIRLKSYSVLTENMSEENANFCYTLLFGDKTLLSENLYQSYQQSGLAHTLSVSGLHVSILIVLFAFLLNKCKMKKKGQFFIIAALLLLYCWLCDFDSPMVRSSIMGLCIILSLLFGERADILSSISFAGILILLFQPLYLFDVGFLLSFSSIFGIIFLAKPIAKLLHKTKLNLTVCDLIGVTIAAQIATLPLIAHYFHTVPIIATLSNLLILPIFSMMFVLLFLFTFLNILLPFGFLLSLVEMLVKVVNSLILAFGKFDSVSVIEFGLSATLSYFVLLYALSEYVMLSLKGKVSVALITALLVMMFALNQNTPNYFQTDSATTIHGVENTVILTTEQNHTMLFNVGNGTEYDYYEIRSALLSKKILNLTYLVIADYTDADQNTVSKLCLEFDVEHLIIPTDLEASTLFGLNSALLTNSILEQADFYGTVMVENIKIDLYKIGSTLKLVSFDMQSLDFSLLVSKLTTNQVQTVLNDFTGSQVLLCERYYDAYDDLINAGYRFVCKDLGTANGANFISTQKDYLFTISGSFDTIFSVN